VSDGSLGEITGFAQRELSDLLNRFRQRRAKLQAAIDAAAELDRLIPRLEKLLAATAPAAAPPRPRPVPEPGSRTPTQKDRVIGALRDAGEPLRAREIADRIEIAPTSVYPLLYDLERNKVAEKDEDGRWTLKEAA
jgi:hypothetical protein